MAAKKRTETRGRKKTKPRKPVDSTRGRTPLPKGLKVLRGTFRPDRVAQPEPKPATKAPKMPSGLPPAARNAWRAWSKMLLRLGILTEMDGPALEALCRAWAGYRKAERVRVKDGDSYAAKTDRGAHVIRTRPEVAISDMEWKRFFRLCQQFGMTPASRARVATTEEPQEDEFESFLNAK